MTFAGFNPEISLKLGLDPLFCQSTCFLKIFYTQCKKNYAILDQQPICRRSHSRRDLKKQKPTSR
jgi:hypothetical protein